MIGDASFATPSPADILACRESAGLAEHAKKITAPSASLDRAAFALGHGASKPLARPAVETSGMKGFFLQEAARRRSWNAVIELFEETPGKVEP